MSKNERVVSDPEAAGWEFDSDTGYWMWKGEEGTGGGLWTDNGDTTISYMDGNVGIGNPSPHTKLCAQGTRFSAEYPIVAEYSDDTEYSVDNNGGGLAFSFRYNSAGDFTTGAVIQGAKENNVDGDFGGCLRFLTRVNGGSAVQQLLISSSGNATFTGSVNLAGGGLKYRTASNITLDSDAIAGYLAIGGTEHYSWNATDFRSQTDGQYDLGASNAKWKDGFFSGAVYVKGSPLTRTVDLITTLVTLRQATMDETQDIRKALRSAIDELVDGFEQEIATMPAPEPESSTQEAGE